MTVYRQWLRGICTMLLLCLYITATAQTNDSIAVIQEAKTTQSTDFRVPSKEKIKEYQKDEYFDYTEPEKGVSIWDQIKYWLLSKFGEAVFRIFDTGLFKILVIIGIALVLVLIILKIAGIDYWKILGKKKIDTAEIDIYTENVHEMDFDTLITNALKNKDYRLAIRFLYLKNLKLLADKEIINWSIHKTNYSYQHEIGNDRLRSLFLETTLIFDYVWYGEFQVDEPMYMGINTRMSNFNQMISNER